MSLSFEEASPLVGMLRGLPLLASKAREDGLTVRSWGMSFRGSFKTTGKYDTDQETMLQEVIDVLPVPVCLVDSAGSIRRTNPEFRSLVDLPVVTLAGENSVSVTNVLEMLSLKDADRFYSRLAEARAVKGVCRLDVGSCATKTLLQGRRALRPVHWTISSTAFSFTNDLYIISACGLSRQESLIYQRTSDHSSEEDSQALLPQTGWDLFKERTERKLRDSDETEIVKLKAKVAAELSDSRRGFLRHMSHEVRTPLSIISSGLAVIRQRAESLDVSAVEIVDDLSAASYDAAGILDDFIAYEKLEGDSLVLERRTQDFLPLLERCLGSLKAPVNNYSCCWKSFTRTGESRWHRRGDGDSLLLESGAGEHGRDEDDAGAAQHFQQRPPLHRVGGTHLGAGRGELRPPESRGAGLGSGTQPGPAPKHSERRLVRLPWGGAGVSAGLRDGHVSREETRGDARRVSGGRHGVGGRGESYRLEDYYYLIL